jgi:MFS family permease
MALSRHDSCDYHRGMGRSRVPEFILEVIRDPGQRGVLIAASLGLFAVGLVPRVLSPGLPDAQERLRVQPGVEELYLLLAFLSAAAVILGGLVSDVVRRRSVYVAGLAMMLGGTLLCIVIDHGPIYYLASITAVVASGAVLAYGIGAVAVAYEGVPRATALGAVYAAYGAGAALAPILLTLIVVRVPSGDPARPPGFAFETWLAYLAAAAGAAIALWAAWRWMPRLSGSLPAPRALVTGIAVWSISILAVVVGLLGLTREGGSLVPMGLIILGVIGLGTLSYRLGRTSRLVAGLHLDQRALGAALAVGVAVGLAQAAPMMMLPLVFERVMGYGTLFAMLAIAPFAIALFVAGPVSGILLGRFGPRGMMTFGTVSLGLANLMLAAILAWFGPGASYLLFIAPLVFIGAGFVLATTVRTAIVFASTPRGLSAMAAAVNEASVALGSRVGIVAATTIIATQAIASAQSMVVGQPDATALVAEFRDALVSLGTPRFQEVIGAALENAPAVKTTAYLTAYLDGVQVALLITGIIGIAGAGLAWILTGRRDPLQTVFDMQDERSTHRAVDPREAGEGA